MHGKREQEMATEVMQVWQWILSLPSSATSKTLELAMQAWISLVSGDGGLSKPEHDNMLGQLAKLLHQVSEYFVNASEGLSSKELQAFLDASLQYAECLKEALQDLAASSPAFMSLNDLAKAETKLMETMELLDDISHARMQEVEKRRENVEVKTASSPSLVAALHSQYAGPSRSPLQSEPHGAVPPPRPRPDNKLAPEQNITIRCTPPRHSESVLPVEPIPSGRYVSGPLCDDPPAYEDRRSRVDAATQTWGQIDDSSRPPQQQPVPALVLSPVSDSDSYSESTRRGRAKTRPAFRSGEEGFAPGPGGCTGQLTARAPSTRAHDEERHSRSRSRDIRTRATTPTIHEHDRSRSRDGRLGARAPPTDRSDGGYARSRSRNHGRPETVPTIGRGEEDFARCGDRNGWLSAREPITNHRRDEEYARSRSRDERGATPPTIIRRDDEGLSRRGGRDSGRLAARAPISNGSHEGHSRSRSRNGRAETEPMCGDEYESTRRAGVPPKHPGMRTTQSDGVVGNGPRESRRPYPPTGRERSRQDGVDRLRHQLGAMRVDSAPSIMTIGSGNFTGNHMRNVGNTTHTFPLDGRSGYPLWTPDHGYDNEYYDNYYYYDDDEYGYDRGYDCDEDYFDSSHQRGGWGREVQGGSRQYN